MGSINYGLKKYARPAERQSGLKLIETFENASEVVKNGGTITGSSIVNGEYVSDGSTGRVNYNTKIPTLTKFTFICDIKDAGTKTGSTEYLLDTSNLSNEGLRIQLQFGGGNVSFVLIDFFDGTNKQGYVSKDHNSFSHLAWVYDGSGATNADKLKLYLDGVKQTLTFVGTIPTSITSTNNSVFGNSSNNTKPLPSDSEYSGFKLFDEALSDQDIQNYFNGTMWDYRNNAVLDLPMTMEDHDPTNTRTLDRSGNGNHATFGDGSTASTFPTKDTDRHGYSFDGGDRLETTVNDLGNNFTVFINMNLLSNPTSEPIFSYYDNDKKYHILIPTNTSIIYGINNKYTIRTAASYPYPRSELLRNNNWFFVFDKTNEKIYCYFNDRLYDTISGGTLEAITGLDVANKCYIGRNLPFGTFTDAKIRNVGIINAGLSPIQIKDLHNELKQAYNRF